MTSPARSWRRYAGGSQVAVYDLDAGEHRTLLTGTTPKFVPGGYLAFWRDGSLWAAPFDSDALETKGEPRPVVEDVLTDSSFGFAYYDRREPQSR